MPLFIRFWFNHDPYYPFLESSREFFEFVRELEKMNPVQRALLEVFQISKVTQGANCPIRSFPPITFILSDWCFPIGDPVGFWGLPGCSSFSVLLGTHIARG